MQVELQAALDAAQLASTALLDAYARFEVIPNAAADISTDADRLAQEIILSHLHKQFPADALRAEETTPTLAKSGQNRSRMWIVDPIDGTRGFARKVGEFSVMIGFVEQNEIIVGVVQEPAKGRLTWAVRGGGCWIQDLGTANACRVTAIDDLAAATLTVSHPRDPRKPTRPVRLLRPAKVVETYSAGVKLALVARGEADLYVNSYDAFHDWDICAGHILVTEAGGHVTKLNGAPLLYGQASTLQQGGILASNGLLHDVAIARMSQADA